jgi:hypothetical protein
MVREETRDRHNEGRLKHLPQDDHTGRASMVREEISRPGPLSLLLVPRVNTARPRPDENPHHEALP